jgi:hypothetical protein
MDSAHFSDATSENKTARYEHYERLRRNLMSSLLELSNNLADIVEQVGNSVVAVNGGTRISPSGIHWRDGIIVPLTSRFNAMKKLLSPLQIIVQ